MLKKILPLGAIAMVATSAFAVVACGVAPTEDEMGLQKSIKNRETYDYKIADAKDEGALANSAFGTYKVLDHDSYNALYTEMKKTPNTVAIALIANGKVDTDIVNVTRNETVLNVLDSSKFVFKRYTTSDLGAFLLSYSLRSNPNVFMHGTNNAKNYGDYYPMYWINHKFAQLGASNFHIQGHEVLEFTFDKK